MSVSHHRNGMFIFSRSNTEYFISCRSLPSLLTRYYRVIRNNGLETSFACYCSEFIKSVSPKISRIGRQKQKNEFFLIWPKEPIWLAVFGNDIKRFDFLFFSSKFAKLENSATRPSAAAMRLEI